MSLLAAQVQPDLDEMQVARDAGDSTRLRAAERARDAKVITYLAELTPLPLARGLWLLTFVDGPRVVPMANGRPVLEMMVALRRNGALVPVDGHLRYPNPRFRVVEADGATITDAPLRALYQMVLDTLAVTVAALRGVRA